MDESQACPDRDRLRALLEDRLPAVERDGLAAHLENCPKCRALLESEAADGGLWDDLKRFAGEAPTDETHPHVGGAAGRGETGGLAFLEPTDVPGRIGRFGPYEVIAIVGKGGMGVVLKAFDPGLHRVVAIKVLAPQLAAGATARRRFLREGRAAASVCHEHVVTIHAVDEIKGFPCLVMQYVGGKSLQERIDRDGPLEVKEILRIGLQAAAGLAAAHAQGLVHRDIKPANILLENGVERVKLSDFGLARAVDDASLTQAGIIAGTPEYMAPEQARGEPVDGRADLFSLGCVLYAMATCRSPFRGPSTPSVLRRVCDEAPRPIRESNPDIPPWLDAVIMKLLAKDPAGRYETAAEVSTVLAGHLASLQHGGAEDEPSPKARLNPDQGVGPSKSAATARPRRKLALAAAGLGALLLLGVGEATGVTQVGEFVATVLKIRTPEGTLILESDDPELRVRVDGGEVELSGGGVKALRLRPGVHEVRAIRDGQGRPAERVELVEITRGGKRTLRVSIDGAEPAGRASTDRRTVVADPPARASAPDAKQLTYHGRLREEAAQSQLREAEARLKSSEIARAAKDKALERVRAQHKAGLVPAAGLEAAEEEAALAVADLHIAETERESAHEHLEMAQAVMAAARGPDAEAGGDPSEAAEQRKELLAAVIEEGREFLEGRLREAEARLARSEVALKARGLERDRLGTLFERGSVPASEVDQAEAKLAGARAEVEAAKGRVRAARDQLGIAAQRGDFPGEVGVKAEDFNDRQAWAEAFRDAFEDLPEEFRDVLKDAFGQMGKRAKAGTSPNTIRKALPPPPIPPDPAPTAPVPPLPPTPPERR